MKNQMLKNFLLNTASPVLLYLALFFPFKCFADFIYSPLDVTGCPPIIDLLGYVAAYFIISVLSLLISCFIIKQKVLIKSRRFLKYILLAPIGGLLIATSGLLIGLSFLDKFQLFDDKYLLIIALINLLILMFYNYWLVRKILKLSQKQSIFIGPIMGIFSNIYLVYLVFLIFRVLTLYLFPVPSEPSL